MRWHVVKYILIAVFILLAAIALKPDVPGSVIP